MSLQIIKPYVHVEDGNGNPYVGAALYIYQPGTTTLANVYSDEALTVPAVNPAVSDAAGNFPRLYIGAGTYKLRAQTAAGVLIWQEDNIDTGLPAGTGALPVSRGGTGATTAAAARANLDVPSNSELTALSSTIATLQSAIQNIVSIPQGYLTLTSGTPIITSDVIAGTAVYYTPLIGNLVPIYDGTQFNATQFSELTLTLNSNHVANAIYDVFLFNNSGTLTIGTGPAWNTATAGSGARGAGAGTTEIVRVNGLQANRYDMTARNGATTYTVTANTGLFVGSIFIDASAGQVTCHRSVGQSRKWSVSNAYNRKPIRLQMQDSTSSWAYTTASIRQSRADATNNLQSFCCLAEDTIDVNFIQTVTSNNASVLIGVGVNSTSAYSGKVGQQSPNNIQIASDLKAAYIQAPALGANKFNCLETGGASGSFLGSTGMLMTGAWWG